MILFNRKVSLIGMNIFIPILGGIEPLSIDIYRGEYDPSTCNLLIRSGVLNYIGGLVRGPANISNFTMTLGSTLSIRGISCVDIPIIGYQCKDINENISYTSTMIRQRIRDFIHGQLV